MFIVDTRKGAAFVPFFVLKQRKEPKKIQGKKNAPLFCRASAHEQYDS